MEAYNKAAEIYGLKTGQILVNHDDFQVRKRMNYLSDTLDAMFKNNIVEDSKTLYSIILRL